MSCNINPVTHSKYLKRPSPPIPAKECNVGEIRVGNDNNLYQIVVRKGRGGNVKRWVKCFTKGTSCPAKYDLSKGTKKIIKSKKKSVNKKSANKKSVNKKCPEGKVINPKTGRCVKVKVVSVKKCPAGKEVNPKTGRCIKIKTLVKKPLPSKKKASKKITVKNNVHRHVVWNVRSHGVMLAHTYKDARTGKISTPPKGVPTAPNGWFLSEKYDGYRSIWNGKNFVSRTGNIFHAPESFKKWMPPGIALDGELYIGRELFEKHGIIRKKTPTPGSWEKAGVKFQIFDSPTLTGNFEERQEKLKQLVKNSCKIAKSECPLRMVKQIKIKDEKQLYKVFDKLTSEGAEGVMLRAPGSMYESTRSRSLLKVKQLFDEECKIIGYKPGTGKYKGMLGAFNCRLMKNPKITFTISGMDDKIRKNYKKTHPLGTIVTFTYMGLSASGVPRHPNYLRIRK